MKGAHFWTVFCLLFGAGLLIHTRTGGERFVSRVPLDMIPAEIGNWKGLTQQIDPEALASLGNGEFLSRIYIQNRVSPPVALFVAYFPSQRTGSTIHSPKHCLPGAGWAFEESRQVNLADADGKPYRVGEYVIANGDQKQFVIYWYQAHGRSVANEYSAKFYLVADAIRTNRTDGALVRVMTSVAPGERVDAGRERAEKFVVPLLTLLPRVIPN